jgi:hypothetical protein
MVLQLAEHVVPSASRSTRGLQGKLGRVGGLAGDVVPSAGRSTWGLPGSSSE